MKISKPEDLTQRTGELSESTEIMNEKIQGLFDWLGTLSLSQWLIIGLLVLIIISIYFYYIYMNKAYNSRRRG